MTTTPDPAQHPAGAPARLGRRELLTLGVRPFGESAAEESPIGESAAGDSPASQQHPASSRRPAPARAWAGTGAHADHWIRVYRGAMACRFEVTLSGEDARHVSAARDALHEAVRLEAALTVFRDTSDLVRLNRTAGDGPAAVDAELFALLARCRDLHTHTGGAFDITSTPLSRCWGFLARQGRLPSVDDIATARARVGMDAVALDPAQRTVHFTRPAMELNLGSIGKGYAVQAIAHALAVRGVRHALISAGASSIVALGGRGWGWEIDLCSRHQRVPGEDARLARIHLRHGALGTSGAGEQFVEVDGHRYGHVLDPRTGWPASGVRSASVVAADGATADALATAFLVGGPDLARTYCAAHPDTLALITLDGAPRPEQFGAYPGAIVEDP